MQLDEWLSLDVAPVNNSDSDLNSFVQAACLFRLYRPSAFGD